MIARTLRGAAAVLAIAAGVGGFSGCANASADAPLTEVRLGYFATVTHAPALIGVSEGLFEEALGPVRLSAQAFGAGPAAIEALSAGAIDAAYVGPSPAITTFVQSGGRSARIVAGAAVGGAALVVRPGIADADDLRGATLATPQLGNTQDVALRTWLRDQGLSADLRGGGDVAVTPMDSAQTLTLFQQGRIDGAWLPEPWVSRMVVEGGAHVLVEEASLWPDGVFPTTVLLVRADLIDRHPDAVAALVDGHGAAVRWIADHPAEAPAATADAIAAITGTRLDDAVIARSFLHVGFGTDPVAGAFEQLVADGVAAGTQRPGEIGGLFDLRILNARRAADGLAAVSAAGLGEDGS